MGTLCFPQFGDEVLHLSRTLAGVYLSLSAPTVYISPPEQGVCLSLADRFGVVVLLFELAYNLGGYVADECGVGDGLVGEIEGEHGYVV